MDGEGVRRTGAGPAALAVGAPRAGPSPEAAAFAVTGESGDTLLPGGGWRDGAAAADPHLPVVVKYLGRWVVVTLEEIPGSDERSAGWRRAECGRAHDPPPDPGPGPALLRQLEEYDFEAFGPTGLRTYDLAVMAQAGAVLLAHVGDEIVGGCQLMRVLDEPDFFYVVGFYIRPPWRGRHFGRELLRLVAEESRALGAKGLVFTVPPRTRRPWPCTRAPGSSRTGSFPTSTGKRRIGTSCAGGSRRRLT